MLSLITAIPPKEVRVPGGRSSWRWVSVVIGAVFTAFWLVHEAGRGDAPGLWIALGLFGAAIALSSWWPLVGTGLACVTVMLQLFGVASSVDANTWLAYFLVAIIGLFAGLARGRLIRYGALALGLLWAALCSVEILLPLPSNQGGWVQWTSAGYAEATLVPIALAATFTALWGVGAGWLAVTVQSELRRAGTQLARTDMALRLEQDRTRIARDIHDSLAHSLAVMVSQAEGALAIQSAGSGIPSAPLRAISMAGRDALIDLRSMLERIQDEDYLQVRRGAADIPELVDRMREAGMRISLTVKGSPAELTETQSIAVYRITQESLTNALKHAGPRAHVELAVFWSSESLHLAVVSVGDTPLVSTPTGPGIGIAGMKERARLAGGTLTADRRSDGAFVVEARIPVRAQHRQPPF